MSSINWREALHLTNEQIEDIRCTGYAYIRQGKYDIAVPLYETLCLLQPPQAYDHQTLGAIYLQLGEHLKAIHALDQALKLEPNHAPSLINLAKAYLLLGKREEGLKVANILKKHTNKRISNMAKALILAYG